MGPFEHAILSNVGWAALLAAGAAITGRFFAGRPALAHSLWVLVLLKLVTPPVLHFAYAGEPTVIPAVSSPAVTPQWPVAAEPIGNRMADGAPSAESLADSRSRAEPSPGDESLPANLPGSAPLITSPAMTGNVSSSVDTAPPSQTREWNWRAVALLLWGLGTLAWGVAVALQVTRFRRLLRAAEPAPASLCDRTARMALRLGLRRTPEVLMVSATVPPMVWALLGPPRILLPRALWDRLDEPQQETILAHELAHLRRRDHWVRWLEAMTLGIYWWNPIAWWARRQVERAEEQCCDAWVVWALPDSVESYAEALVATTAFLSGTRRSSPVGATGIGPVGTGRVAELRRRLTMILSESGLGGFVRPASRTALIAGAVLLLLLPGWAPGEPGTPPVVAEARSDAGADAPAATQAEQKGTEQPAQADPAVSKAVEAPALGSPRPEVRPMPSDAPNLPVTPVEVDVIQPVVADVVEYRDLVGRIEAPQGVEIRAQASGHLTKIHAAEGTIVEKGSLLFEIDPRPYEAELRKAQAEVVRCEAQLKLRAASLKRTEQLSKSNVISQQEVDKAAGERDEAAAILAVAQPTMELARLKLESTRIVAPVRGRLSRARLVAGELVTAETTILATIESGDPLLVGFDLDQQTVLKLIRSRSKEQTDGAKSGLALLVGLPIEIGLSDDTDFPRHGKIESTDSRIVPETGTLRCRAAISNSGGVLLPGLFVRGRMPLGPPYESLLIPRKAIDLNNSSEIYNQAKEVVGFGYPILVVDEKGEVAKRLVTLGEGRAQDSGLQAIRTGPNQSEWVVARYSRNIRRGDKVLPNKVAHPARPSEAAP